MTRFKEWLTNEAGHFSYTGGLVTVKKSGKMVTVDIDGVDPQFEKMNIPDPESPGEKFLGQSTFSLPVVGGYLVSKRLNMLSGTAEFRTKSDGVEVPSDWADNAQFVLRTPVISRER